MSGETTPAIERAEAAIYKAVWGGPRDEDRAPDGEEYQDARTVLAAALDRDEIARAIYDQSVLSGEVAADCFGIDWDTTDAFYSEADAVITSLLGPTP